MNKSPLVSICCVTYNHAPFIRQCLDGFISQRVDFDYEIIINDDCSTDGTIEIIKEYKEKYPDIIYPIFHEKNQYSQGVRGIFSKFCFPIAKGKYIAICEGDDYWDNPCKLQLQVDFLENNSDYSMCFTRAKVLLEIPSNIWIKCFNIEDREYSATELFSEWIVPTGSIMFTDIVKQQLLEQDGSYLNGDIVFVQRAAHLGKVRGMSVYTTVYRMQQSGVTYNEKSRFNAIMRYPEHYECIKRNFPLIDEFVINKYIAEAYYNRAIVQKNTSQMKSDFCKADEIVPGFCRCKRIEHFKSKIRNIVRSLL